MFVLDIAFTLGILASVLKGADLMLRPHQQKKIQVFVEELALKLAYARTLNISLSYLHNLSRNKLVCVLTGSNAMIFLAFFSFNLDRELIVEVFGVIGSLIFILISSLIGAFVSLDLYEGRIRYYLSSKSWREFLWRTFEIVEYTVILLLFLGSLPDRHPFAYFIPIYIGGYLSIAYMLLLFFTVIAISEATVKIGNAIVWRLVEYNKGAYAAIILALTILLGFIELYIRQWK